MSTNLGLTDLPAKEDYFSIESYKDSMAEFIANCNTPMTISVQGTWGTGKTTFMRMVSESEKLRDCKFIEFNTWQCSQFAMDGTLSVSLIQSLIDDMGLDEEQKSGMNKVMRGVGTGARMVISVLAEKMLKNGTFGASVGEIMSKIGEALLDTGDDNPIKEVKKIKEEFKKCVKQSLEKNKKSRLIVFIDDLDRLEPRKAVELLEVLKNFLDCENCVFVLAIDYDVVCKGVAAKYGNNQSGTTLDSKKGKDFFDKIIQVPFKMPVAQYSTENYLRNCLCGVRYNEKLLFEENENFESYYTFTSKSVGTNPRAIKRLVNAFQLLVLVVQNKKDFDIKKNKLLVFAILCLQELDLNVYNSIVRKRNDITEDKILAFIDKDVEVLSELYPNLIFDEEDEDAVDLDGISEFVRSLIAVIDIDGKVGLSPAEVKVFQEVLALSAITSTDSESVQTKRGSRILNSFDELEMGAMTNKEIEYLANELNSLGNVTVQPIRTNAKRCLIRARIGDANGPTFADVYGLKKGYSIDCFVPRKEMLYDQDNYPDVANWVASHRFQPSGKRLSPSAYNDDEKADLSSFVKAVYSTWVNNTN